ncbi:MAG: hypothetical protein U5O39_16850 [Gammaproteobacteria bacterium]|nr:hypothetical protein [Gammaproteobacteria bacterium]
MPDELADEAAVLVEPLAAALEIPDSVAIGADTRVLIVGAGRLAVLIAQVISARTTHLDVLVRRPERRPAFEGAGIICVDTPGHGYDVVVEASGQSRGI